MTAPSHVSVAKAIVESPPTPQELHAQFPDEESNTVVIARFAAGGAKAFVDRTDWWLDGVLTDVVLGSGIDWDDACEGCHHYVQVYTDEPGSVAALPGVAAVLTAVHDFITSYECQPSTTVVRVD
ncbi:hypothetical protein [Williamsia herbipolensis]|uniref:hypothetical protein n=1 Tax=Williamsia herbipolensis TaxID=1603258 RepID=UPI0005F798C1|nr:hypothetical protein [Williamsia herbipolensis]